MTPTAMGGVLPGEALLRGEPQFLSDWVQRWELRRMATCVGLIFVGSGMYGAAMGWWRSPLQGLFVALKFPLIILGTSLGNALLNAMIAPLLGLNLPWRQSLQAILMSFAIASAILGSFSPLAAFVVWSSPAMSPNVQASWGAYNFIQLMHVAIIAFAGIVANVRLVGVLRALSGKGAAARRVLWAWLACNLFLGSQLSWICRPFIGSPALAVQFLRPNAFQGNFYESVFRAWSSLAGTH